MTEQTIAKLKAFIRADMETYANAGLHYGGEWWALSEAEAEVFGLSLDVVPSLLAIWCAFEASIDICYPWTEDHSALFAEVRQALPWIGEKAALHQLDADDFVRFARLVDMPTRYAEAWFYKRHFQDARSGILQYKDDPENSLPF